jgi:hypothetical protein
MHIVLSLLGAILTVLYILERLGIDVGGLNPFSWQRRRDWAKRYQADPIYSIEEPMHVAAILVVGAAKLGGDLTAEQKSEALRQFAEVFSLDARQASELYASASHLLGAPQILDTQLNGVLDKNKDRFSNEQAKSFIAVAESVTAAGSTPTERQLAFLEELQRRFLPPPAAAGTWG